MDLKISQNTQYYVRKKKSKDFRKKVKLNGK